MNSDTSSSSTVPSKFPGETSSNSKEAFEFFPDDAEAIFQQFQNKTGNNQLTVENLHSAYNVARDHKVACVKDVKNMSASLRKFHEELLDNKDPSKQKTLDQKSFVQGISKANQILMMQPEYKREEIMKEMERLCLELTNNDPKFFMDMLDLPGALLLEDVKTLMAQIK